MTTKKSTAKQMTKVEVIDMPAYGKKSDPSREAIEEMISKHSESSSEDSLHSARPQPRAKGKRTK